MKQNNNSSSGGIGFFGLLTILFIALKLLGYITWSWWLVFIPVYAYVLILLFLVVIVMGYYNYGGIK